MGEGSNQSGINFPSSLFLQRDAFTYEGFYTGRGLHREIIFPREMILQKDVSAYRCSDTEILSTQRCFYTLYMILHEMIFLRETFGHRRIFTQVSLRRDTFRFSQVFLHVVTFAVHSALRTQTFFQVERFIYKQTLLHRGTLTPSGRHVYMQILLRRFSFSARMLCHRDAFDHMLLHRDICTN